MIITFKVTVSDVIIIHIKYTHLFVTGQACRHALPHALRGALGQHSQVLRKLLQARWRVLHTYLRVIRRQVARIAADAGYVGVSGVFFHFKF